MDLPGLTHFCSQGVTTLDALSTGTAVVALPSATDVLQLTAGMYSEMEKASESKGWSIDCCLAKDEEDYARVSGVSLLDLPRGHSFLMHRTMPLFPTLNEQKAVRLASDKGFQAKVRAKIYRHNHVLYESQKAIEEWSTMLRNVHREASAGNALAR